MDLQLTTLKQNIDENQLVCLIKEIFSNKEAMQVIVQTSVIDVVKDLMKQEVKSVMTNLTHNINDLIEKFLNTFQSKATRSTYKNSIRIFLDYCKEKSINPLQLNCEQADLFAAQMINTKTKNSANICIDSVSSFYKTLVKWNVIEKLPFIKVKRSKGINSKEAVIPTETDVKKTLDYCKENDKKLEYYTILMMQETGMRIGGFNKNFKIQAGGLIKTVSKGKPYTTKIDETLAKEIIKELTDKPYANVNKFTLYFNIQKALTVTHGLNKFSHHDIRHLFAKTLYLQTKDIYKVSKALNHSDIAITTKYLASIDVLQ